MAEDWWAEIMVARGLLTIMMVVGLWILVVGLVVNVSTALVWLLYGFAGICGICFAGLILSALAWLVHTAFQKVDE